MEFFVIKNVHVVNEGSTQVMDVAMHNVRFSTIAPTLNTPAGATEINGDG
jgi:dihydroorotase